MLLSGELMMARGDLGGRFRRLPKSPEAVPDDGGGRDAETNSFSQVWIKSPFSCKAAGLTELAFQKHTESHPLYQKSPLCTGGIGLRKGVVCPHVNSFQQSTMETFVLGREMHAAPSVTGIQREPQGPFSSPAPLVTMFSGARPLPYVITGLIPDSWEFQSWEGSWRSFHPYLLQGFLLYI